jgi:hypothetical protein
MFVRPGRIRDELGISTATLRRMAEDLPTGAVLSTPGGHYLYDFDAVKKTLLANATQAQGRRHG